MSNVLRSVVFVLAALLAPLVSQAAGLNTWTGGGNDTNWATGGNWDQNHAPAGGEIAVINGAQVNLYTDTADLGGLIVTNGAILSVYSPLTNGSTSWGLLVSVSGTVTIAANSWINPYSQNTNGGSAWFRCQDLVVDATSGFNANDKGYAGAPNDNASGRPGYGPGTTDGFNTGTPGPSYGGKGGTAYHTASGVHYHYGGETYGDYTNPIDPGSGGGGGAPWTSAGGAGGGLIRVLATDSVIMDGSMLANGQTLGNSYAAPGSGGGIYVQCKTIRGSGLLSARGGDLQRASLGGEQMGGAGGGGRIAIVYDTGAQVAVSPQPTIRLNAAGGSQNESRMNITFVRLMRGGPGSLFLSDNQFFDLAKIQGGEILVPGVSSATLNSLSVSNGFIKFPSGFSLTVTQDVTLTSMGGLDLSNAVVAIGRDFIISSDFRAGAIFRGGASQQLSIGRNASVDQGWLEITHKGTVTIGGNVTLTNTLPVYTLPGWGSRAYFQAGVTNGATAYGMLLDVVGNLTISTNCWVFPTSHPTNGGSVYFQAAKLDVFAGGGFNADELGYAGGPGYPNSTAGKAYGPGAGGGTDPISQRGPGGGGYGGEGKSGVTGLGGSTYGSSNAPVDPGSGGGGSYHPGTAGGGLIHAVIKDSVLMDGSMLASSGDMTLSYGSCGSGGGIYVNCKTFGGAGLLKANGGSSVAWNDVRSGGSGGGGRIAVAYTVASTWSGTALANGGVGVWTGNVGTNGTVVFMLVPPDNPGTLILVK
jgi:hypothetical protein